MNFLWVATLFGLVITQGIYGSDLERLADNLANTSLTNILGRRPFLDNRDNADYTDYVAEEYFLRLISAAPNYHFFVFSVMFHKNWVGLYMIKQFKSEKTDVFGHYNYRNNHYQATAIAFGFMKQ